MNLKIYLITILCCCFIGQVKGQNREPERIKQTEFERNQSELKKLKDRAISFQNFFFGMNTRRVEYYRRRFLRDFAREIEQGEVYCEQIKHNNRAYRRRLQRLKKQKKIFQHLKEYKFSFKDGDIPTARANKKLIEQFIRLVEDDLKQSKSRSL